MPALQCLDRREDVAQDTVDVFPDVVIAISPDGVALAFEPSRPHVVAITLAFPPVLVAIGFDDKTQFQTDKIDNVSANRMLPAETRAEFLAPKMFSECFFRLGEMLAQMACMPDGHETPPSLTLPRKGGGNKGVASGTGGQYVNDDALPITSDPSYQRSA